MIRNRFKSKVTLAIGDGANDVNMILSSHVGVGILGKEGQQAARSADFAIGQFKFLKPLLFVHGRECNRRNSILVLYIFYKNVLYIACLYLFGFWSMFSGQTLYESIIYQFYNITMTSLPIMFFALFDFEYLKKEGAMYQTSWTKWLNGNPEKPLYLMDHPLLFQRSMHGEYFTIAKFVMYLLYSLFHAIIIYFFCFHLVEGPSMQPDGKNLGLWVPGHLVYGACIIVANFTLLMRFNNFAAWGEALVYLMILSYFTLMHLESQVGLEIVPDLYYVFPLMFNLGLVWLQLIICGCIALALEIGFFYAYRAYDAEGDETIFNEKVEYDRLIRNNK